MKAVSEETKELVSLFPDKVKAKILSLLSESPSDSQVVSEDFTGHFSSGLGHASIGDILRLQGGVLIQDDFLLEGCKAARLEAEKMIDGSNIPAGIGGDGVQVSSWHRGDRTCWVQPAQCSAALRIAADHLLDLQQDLALWGYDVGGRPSIQLSMYPGDGARYVRHTDASDSVPTRTVTAILYLNPGWDPATNGGQLCIYHLAHKWRPGMKLDRQSSPGYAAGEPAMVVAPIGNRLVVFESNIPHEVLPTSAPRFALTVWFSKATPSDACLAIPKGLPEQSRCRIFVSIASFRDPETRWTVHDLLTKASHPARLNIGIVWQIDASADAEFLRFPSSINQDQMRQIIIPAKEATGPCKARMLSQKLWAGEDYWLQIDSHMRFVPGWDEHLIHWLAACEQNAQYGKAVLSTYPPEYEGCGLRAQVPADDRPVQLRASHFGLDGMLRLVGSRLAEHAATPLPSFFWAAGFSFSRSQLIQEVPYEDLPFLFFGEEQYMLARMFTHGYDVFSPPRSVAYHRYSRSYRETFQAAAPQDPAAKEDSKKIVLELFNEDSSCTSPSSMSQQSEHRLGKFRSISDLHAMCGVQYSQQVINDAAKRGTANESVRFTNDE
ncbi:probable Egl nine homolog 3 at N-terminal half [Coccomyxa sp. Obi]|nr:probable Egl nine homolog 3 at N-terminal half [Coccomyxa sp. Obi]